MNENTFLLFDDAFIEEKQGFQPRIQEMIPSGEPVITAEQAWEIGGITGDSNVSVIDAGGKYQLWYVVPHPHAHTGTAQNLLPAQLEGMDAKTMADFQDRARYMLCYAVSTDGVHWSKPDLDVVQYDGRKESNIVYAGRLGCTVFADPSAAPEERYKIITGAGPRLPHVVEGASHEPVNIYHGIYGGFSRDGIHWHTYETPIIPWYTDTTNGCFWDDERRRYVAFVRWNEGMGFSEEKTTSESEHRIHYRAIGRTESADFTRFPPPDKILEPLPRDREPYETGMDLYNTSALKYPFASQSYFLFSSDFYHGSDYLDIHLYTSRDGESFTRWETPLLRLGLDGAFDSSCVYMATGMILRGDLLHLYYFGSAAPHGGHAERPPYSGAIGMVRVPRDRFVSQEAASADGSLVTVPLRFEGSELQLNMDGSAGGRMKVAVLDEHRTPIAGFTADDADWLWGNSVRRTVTWKGQSDLSQFAGKTMRLHFTGERVRLYAFRFV